MCGIAGIYNSNQSSGALRQVGDRMVALLHHRGPDARGVEIRSTRDGSRVMLAHTRLSIIDLSEDSSQPMSFGDETLWIVFNGEIYNYQELKSDLQKLGVQFRTNGDTEVILAAYHQWGVKCFDRFVGMWALALWDERQDLLILSRDRLGIKPLYFARQGESWIFGSEPKVIIEQAPEFRKLNIRAVSDYFSFRYTLGGNSFFVGIHSVESGTHKIIHRNEVKTIRYWDLPVVVQKEDPGEKIIRQQLDEVIGSSVAYRMIADVPVGSFLSGGLDSSVLVWEMAKRADKQLKTFTIGFKEEGFNEFEYADEVARQCRTDHKEILLNVDEYLNSFQTMLRIKDAPLAVPNEIALHKLSKVLKKDITVVLSGEGADELFGGYGRIFQSAYDYHRVQKYGSDRLPKDLRANLLKKYSDLSWKGEIDHFLGQYFYLDASSKTNIFTEETLKSLGDDPHNHNYFIEKWKKLDGLNLHEKYMWIFQKVHLEGLLGRLDSATMSASVEGRVPFVDHRVIEYINQLPIHYKMRWKNEEHEKKAELLNSDQISETHDTTKYLLRSQYQNRIPESITNRRKVGFPVPLGKWLSGQFRDYAQSRMLSSDAFTRSLFQRNTVKKMLDGSSTNPKDGLKVWMLLNVEDWMRAYNVSV